MKVLLSDEKLLTTKKASELTGYSQDYLGQLCRGGVIKCRFIGRQWYVVEDSIKDYAPKMKKPKKSDYYVLTEKNKIEKVTNIKKDAKNKGNNDINAEQKQAYIKDTKANTFEINGKLYISTQNASELTGYNPDYIGQLCRKKEIDAIKVGKRWFVNKNELLEHKKQKDAMLAKVQAEAVGFKKRSIYNEIANMENSLMSMDLGIRYIDDTYVTQEDSTDIPILHKSVNNTFSYNIHDDNVMPIKFVDENANINTAKHFSLPSRREKARDSQYIKKDINVKDIGERNKGSMFRLAISMFIFIVSFVLFMYSVVTTLKIID